MSGIYFRNVLTDDFDAAFAQAAFAPVLVPESDAANLRGGPFAGLINLVEAFPSRRCQSGSEHLKAVGGGILSGAQKSVFEAGKAALAALGLIGERLRGQQPLVVIVVIVDDVEPQILGKPCALVFADLVFALRINVWIATMADEHGAQQACSSTFASPSGTFSLKDIRIMNFECRIQNEGLDEFKPSTV